MKFSATLLIFLTAIAPALAAPTAIEVTGLTDVSLDVLEERGANEMFEGTKQLEARGRVRMCGSCRKGRCYSRPCSQVHGDMQRMIENAMKQNERKKLLEQAPIV